ncbi:Uncharacterized protein APZ42_007511, partial [Daphnia magna]
KIKNLYNVISICQETIKTFYFYHTFETHHKIIRIVNSDHLFV